MTDAGFFKGTSAEQDARFADKKKKLMKTMKFGENLTQKVDMSKINLESIRPWIVKRITELLNFEDEVVCDYIFNQLEERHPDPKEIQINITGFLNSKNARIFLSELWDLLLSAMQTPDGVPAAFLEAKKEEIAKRQEDEKLVHEMRRKESELIPKGSGRIPNPSSEQMDNQKRVSNVKSNGVAESGETQTVTDRNRSPSRTSSPSPHPPTTATTITSTQSRENLDKENSRVANRDKTSSSHSPEPRHRRRRHRHSLERSPVNTKRRRSRSRSRHRHQRSTSPSKLEQKPKSSVTDWRKDLMAGRRRSPPEMPESSYYGNEKRSKTHKHSKKHGKQRHSNDYSHKPYKRSPSHNNEHYRAHKRTHNAEYRQHNLVEFNERDQRSGYSEQARRDSFPEISRKYEGPDPPSHYDYHPSNKYRHDSGLRGRNSSPEPNRTRPRESDWSLRDHGYRHSHQSDQVKRREMSSGRANLTLDRRQYGRLPSPEGPTLPPNTSKRPSDSRIVEGRLMFYVYVLLNVINFACSFQILYLSFVLFFRKVI
ncbi:Serine/arginine repetitive matrix protein 1 [Schistosoma japonicum]|nr:Serine/arginine repetitive matrix protein 1 [Schistosoma japonicum]